MAIWQWEWKTGGYRNLEIRKIFFLSENMNTYQLNLKKNKLLQIYNDLTYRNALLLFFLKIC